MGFWGRLKRGATAFNKGSAANDRGYVPAAELPKSAQPITTEERLTELKQLGGIEVLVSKVGYGTTRRVWSIEEIDAIRFGMELADEFGGGTFELTFMLNSVPLKLKSGAVEIRRLNMGSLPGDNQMKTPQKKGSEAAAVAAAQKPFIDADAIKLALAGLSAGLSAVVGGAIPLVKSYLESRPSAPGVNDFLEGFLKIKQLSDSNGDGVDPFALLDRAMEFVTKAVATATPQITTDPNAAGAFGSTLGNLIEGLAKGYVVYEQSKQGALPGAAPQAAAIPENVPPAAAAQEPAEQGFRQGQGGTVNPLLFLGQKFEERTDPETMARYAIQAMDNIATYSPDLSPAAWSELEQNPGAGFDVLAAAFPTLQSAPEYANSVRGFVISYFADEEEEAEETPEEPETPIEPEETPEEPDTQIEPEVEANVESSDNQPAPDPEPSEHSPGVEPAGPGEHDGPGKTSKKHE